VRSGAVSALTFPLVGFGLYTATVVGTHLSGFMNLVLTHPVVHDLEHVLYLGVGYLYFLPLVGREPLRWRLSFPTQLFFLVLAMPVDTFTGVVLTQTSHELFPAYVGRRDWGPSLVDDLHAGGAVMWIGGDGLMLVFILMMFAGVLAGRRSLDAGRWLESLRSARLAELTAGSAPAAARAPSGVAGVAGSDADDAQLAAYNDYLARLNSPGEHLARWSGEGGA
jgi:putative copper resistance protein D